MAAAKRLRAVRDGDAPKPAAGKRKTVKQAAESGDRRELLVSMRDRVARTVSDPDCPPRDLAALTRRLQEIAREIEQIDARAKQEADEDVTVGDEEWDASVI